MVFEAVNLILSNRFMFPSYTDTSFDIIYIQVEVIFISTYTIIEKIKNIGSNIYTVVVRFLDFLLVFIVITIMEKYLNLFTFIIRSLTDRQTDWLTLWCGSFAFLLDILKSYQPKYDVVFVCLSKRCICKYYYKNWF